MAKAPLRSRCIKLNATEWPSRPFLCVFLSFLAVCTINLIAYFGAVAKAFSYERPGPTLDVFGSICQAVAWPMVALMNEWNFYYDDFFAFVTVIAMETVAVSMLFVLVWTLHRNRGN